jgi:cation transport ATPase
MHARHHHQHALTMDFDATAGTIYTCPMHPKIRQFGPGHCPKCGMALEPLVPTEVEDEGEIHNVRRRFWMATALAIPVMLIAMAPHLWGQALDSTTAWTLRVLELALSAPVVLWAAAPYYRRGWLGVVHRAPNMYTLIGLGVIVAFTYSIAATVFPGQFPAPMRDTHGMVGVYFEVAAVIVAGAPGRMAGTHRARAHERCHSAAPGTDSQEGAPARSQRGRGRPARVPYRWRSASRPTGREDPCRWPRRERPIERR